MAQANGQNEPSMEEILASIRRIISEDEKEQDEAAAGGTAASEAQPDDDVLELTRRVDEPGEGDKEQAPDVEHEEEPEASPEVELAPEVDDAEEQGAQAEFQPESEASDVTAEDFPADLTETQEASPSDGLISAGAASAAIAALSEVSRSQQSEEKAAGSLPVGESQTTLDALVRQALTPLLKAWLDENLPPLVERVVRDEVRRLARRAEDG